MLFANYSSLPVGNILEQLGFLVKYLRRQMLILYGLISLKNIDLDA
jgi:hypothetical protein